MKKENVVEFIKLLEQQLQYFSEKKKEFFSFLLVVHFMCFLVQLLITYVVLCYFLFS